jgi:EAL domain-containing protein (putative c-di-GMP-specific phosphodiesterase class I)
VDADALAAHVHEAFRAPFELGDVDVSLTISIGIAIVEWGKSADSLLRMAEVAARSARVTGGDRTVTFTAELDSVRTRKLRLYRDLLGAADRNELVLNYQPIVGAAGGVVALEALLRWHHPVYGLVSPDEFIPLAEENGTILPIGRWVVQTACREVAGFRASCGSELRIAVNVSPVQFSGSGLLESCEDALRASGLPSDALEIEITESTIASDPVAATEILATLRARGVTVAVDDFGTGYSSLAHLRRFPIDTMKIDRSFVAVIPSDPDACAIVDTILGLARQLSLSVTAEGVETEEQARYLRERGCTLLQGYHFARPLAAEAVVDFINGF